MKPIFGSILARVARQRSALALLCAFAGTAAAQVLDIANSPLYGGRQPHPNVVVATSVEYPTVGAAYLNVRYIPANSYVGYFDNTKCYDYKTGNGGYFDPTVDANSNHECSNAFSGNFMNWVSMSAIDEFRYAMTGGNRDDENGPKQGTILKRAYLPDGTVTTVPDFYALPQNFPRHVIGANGFLDGYPSSRISAVLPSAPSNDGALVYITNCKSQIYFGSQADGNCGNPRNDYGTYNIRINVCDQGEGPVRKDLCQQYTSGSSRYKPVGQAQINAAVMRFAAFGYLMDRNLPGYSVPAGCDNGTSWNTCRYGGVLRAPMKYVGPTKYDANLATSTNAKSEVNADGTFVTDPEGTASSAGGTYSGFINYINHFGATGVYKVYDPGGEMFYEAVRYFQGLQPTDLAITNSANNGVKDYFPITTTWTDPIQSICSANYIINVSDANTWNDTYIPGFNNNIGPGPGRPSSRAPDSGLDANLWATRIGDLESTTTSLTPDDVRPNLAGLQNQKTGLTGTSSQLVAGVAYWANTNDVRTDLSGVQTIKTISVDVAEGSTDVHDRALYLMGKYGGFKNTLDRSSDAYPNPFWATNPANPQGAAIRSNSEWQDATGFPTNYLLASDPQKLITGIRAAFAAIGTNTGTLSGAALTSANLTFGAAGAYVATFNPAKWSGSVLLSSLSVDSSGNLVVSTAPVWDSGALLTARCGTIASASTVCSDTSADVNKRNIVTTAKILGARTATPFTLLGITMDSSYLGALSKNPSTGSADLLAGARINYLRGYRGDEATTSTTNFRVRDSAMGDIVNSGPVYVGAPNAGVPDSDFQQFYLDNANRTAAVYVGANDGMLHALRASDGFELFSYVPGYSYPDLNDLTNPGYVHQVYVDTVPKVQDVKLNGTWKSVLVGANGNGAQGIFGLDVTDPTTFGTSKVLFEFSDADDADFGSVLSPVEVAKLWVGGTAAAPVFRYFAVVTGYNKNRTTVNNRTDTNVTTDTNDKGVLFLIALDHTLGSNWTLNTDYYKFYFPATNTSVANGLGPVSLLLSKSGDLSTAYMYFGDLQGNLWKLNTGTGNPSTWAPVRGTVAAPLPIFVAQDGSSNRQPITARPELAGGPFGSTLVYFGTGKFVGQTDLTLPAPVQSEYSLLDVNPSVLITRSSDLVQRTASISGSNLTITGSAFSYSGPSSKKGWYLDFPSSVSLGERSVTKPAIRTGLLTFTTLTLSNDLCTPGNGYIYQVNALTGLPFGGPGTVGGYSSTVGIPGPPRVVDLTIQAGVTQATGEVINKKTQVTLVSGTAGKIAGYGDTSQRPMPPTQQINWREITNWNTQTGHN